MRQSIAYLVVLMVMLAAFASFRLNPPGLLPFPGNLVLTVLLAVGAMAVALRRAWSFPVGLVAALCAAVGGLLSFRGWWGTMLPGHPVVWVVAGLYVAFRLTINRHAEDEARRKRQERTAREQESASAQR